MKLAKISALLLVLTHALNAHEVGVIHVHDTNNGLSILVLALILAIPFSFSFLKKK